MDSSVDWVTFAPPSLVRDLRSAATGALPDAGAFEAAVLFADVSGFTALAARMAERGVSGTEELTHHLNVCFGTMLRLVREAGGEVEKFVGDGLVATFRTRAGEPAAVATVHAAACALAICRAIEGQQTPEIALRVHAGVGVGNIRSRHVRLDDEQRAFILSGDPIEQATAASGVARDGEACLSSAAALLAGDSVDAVDAGSGFWKIVRVVSPARAAAEDAGAGGSPELHRYLNRAILERAAAGRSTAWLAELRRASVVFVSIRAADDCDLDDDRLAEVARVIGVSVARLDALLFDFLTGDKGLVAIVLFGIRNAHEDDAARAVSLALDLHEVLRQAGVAPAIGVTSGRVYCGVVGSETRKELAVVGDAMNLAARLMGAANGGVLCAPATSREAGDRFTFEPVRGLVLKNVAPGFVAHRPTLRTAGPASRNARSAAVVGRDEECAVLDLAVRQHRQSPAFRAFVLEGEAGIGKSALVQRSEEEIQLRVTGDAIDQVSPYRAWREATAALLDVDLTAPPDAQRDAILRRMQPLSELAPLAPLLGALLPHAPPETPRTLGLEPQARAEQTRDAVLALVQGAAESRPLLILVEDAHWFDSASRALIQQLAMRALPVMLIITTRPATGAWAPKLAELCALPGVSRLKIGPLSLAASTALACSKLSVGSLSPAVESLIFERAAGHPFFTEELTLALRDAKLVRIERDHCMLASSDRDRTALALPDTLERVLTSRIDRLAERQRLTLKVASVLGRDFSIDTLRAVFPGGGASLGADVQSLCDADLLVDRGGGEMRFKHAITQEVGYSLLPFAQRRDLHRAVAECIEARHAGDVALVADLLAHHWGHAGVPHKAVRHAEEAGKRALRRFANREAVHFFREALRFQELAGVALDVARVAGWESNLGLAHRALGELALSQRNCESALVRLSQPVPAKTPRARIGLVAQVVRMFATRPRVTADRAPDAAANTALNAYMQLSTLHHYANDLESMMFSTAHAVPVAKRAGATIEVATLYGSVAHMAAFMKLLPASRAYAQGAHAVARVVQTPHCTGSTFQYTGHLGGCLGDLDTLDRDMHKALEAYAELGPGRLLEEALTNLGYLYQFQGDLPRALETMQALERSGRARDDSQTTGWGIVGQGRVLLCQGELEPALERLNAAEAIVTDNLTVSELFGNRALAYFRSGDRAAALADAARTVKCAEERPATSYTTLPGYGATMEVLVLTCTAEKGNAEARELATRMHRAFGKYAKLFPIAEPAKAVWDGAMLELDGRRARALAALERAARRARESKVKDDEAVALRWLARVQSGSSRRTTLRRVAEEFTRLGRMFEAREATEMAGTS